MHLHMVIIRDVKNMRSIKKEGKHLNLENFEKSVENMN